MRQPTKRTQVRTLAMQAIYQLDAAPETFGPLVGEFILNSDETDGEIKALARAWSSGCWEQRERIDRLIREAAEKWEVKRIAAVDRAILRLAVFELAFGPDTPPKVVINEALELARTFSGEASVGFVNGVLDAVRKELPEA